MTPDFKKFSSLLVIGLSLTGCSSSDSPHTNMAFAMTQGPLLSYSGEPFLIDPIFTAYEIKIPITPYASLSDSVTLGAFSDDQCSQASTGTLTLPSDSVPLRSGAAQFSNSVFGWTSPSWKEGIIYLKASLVSHDLSYCSFSIPIIQHFNLGHGWVTSGTSGAAGATGTAVVDQGRAHRLDSDGKWVIAGMSKDNAGGTQATLWRYLPDGTPDPDFGTQGGLSLGSTGAAGATNASQKETVNTLTIDSNGSYVFAGSSKNSSGGTEFAIWRYRTSGLKDGNFGGGAGSIHSVVSGSVGSASVFDQIRALVIDPKVSKSYVVAGSSLNAQSGTELFLARYLTTGQIDTSFNTTGILALGATGAAGGTTNQTSDLAHAIQIDSAGRYLVAGSSQDNSGKKHMAIWRVQSNGTLDTSWGTQGVIVTGSTSAAGGSGANLLDEGKGLLIDSKNRIVIVGTSKNSSGKTELALWRFSQDGTPDSSWNGTGSIHISTPASSQGLTIAEDSNENYIVSGTSTNASAGNQLTVWMIDSNGNLNSLFNSQGYVTNTSGAAGGTGANLQDIPYSLVVDPYGTYTIVGESKASDHTELSLWRYLSIGTLDL